MVYQSGFAIRAVAKSFHDITSNVEAVLAESGLKQGLCNLFIRHTSASILITENADPDVRLDLENYFSDLVPESGNYIHSTEGKDDMPAHIRSVLTQTSLSVPFANGQLQLGTWQGIYVWEHRAQSHSRKVILTLIGE